MASIPDTPVQVQDAASTSRTGVARLLNEALSLIQRGQRELAEISLRQVLRLVPSDLDATVHLVRLLIDRGELTEAVALLGPGMKSAPHRMDAFAPLVLELWVRGVTEAEPLLTRLAQSEPAHILANFLVGERVAVTDVASANRFFMRAANATPIELHHWLYQALSLIRLGRGEQAEAPLRHVLTLAPGHVDATVHLTRLFLDRDRFADAISILRPGMESVPHRRDAFAPLVHELWYRGVEDAEGLLRQLAESDPPDIQANYLMGVRLAATEAPEANTYLRRAADGDTCDASSLLYQALSLMRLRQLDRAEARLRQVLALEPRHLDATVYLVRLLIDRGQLTEALALLSTGIESAPHRMDAFAPLVLELGHRGVGDAKELLRGLAEDEPPQVEANYLMGELLAKTKPLEAGTYFQRAADGDARDASPLLYQALSLIRLTQFDLAEARLRQILTNAPRHLDATVYLIRLLIDRGRLTEALALVGAGIASAPERMDAFAPFVLELSHRGVSETESLLRRLAEREPPHIGASYMLGERLAKTDPARAKGFFERAANTSPTEIVDCLYQALSLMRLDQRDRAESVLRSVLTREPGHVDAVVYLTRLLIDCGRFGDAMSLLEPRLASRDRMDAVAPLVLELWFRGAKDVEPVVRRLAKSEPINVLANYVVGEQLTKARSPEAKTFFRRAADGEGTDVSTWLCQALSLIRLDETDRAEAKLRQALVREPGHLDATLHLIRLLAERGRIAEALALLRPEIESTTVRVDAFAPLLFELLSRGVRDVKPLLAQLADNHPLDILANFLMGEEAVKIDASGAKTYFERAAEAPLTESRFGLHKALSLIRLDRADEAEALLVQYLLFEPNNIQAANILAERHIDRDQMAEAISILRPVIEAGPPFLASLALPVFRLRTRGVAEADALLEQISEKSSDDPATLTELARMAYYCEAPHWCIRLTEQVRAIADTPELRVSHDLVLPLAPGSVDEIEFWLDRFRTKVEALATSGIRVTNPLQPFVQPPHYAPFCYGVNPRELYVASSRAWLALHPELAWTSPKCVTWKSRPLRRRLRIAFLVQPTFPLVWGMARGLNRERFDVGLIYEESARSQKKTPWSEAVDWELAIPETSVAAGREAIAKQDLDILVHMPWFGFRYFVSHARLAPVQCVLTEPAYTDGSPNLDYYISWSAAEPAHPEEFYTTSAALMNRPPYWIERDYTKPPTLPRSSFDLPEDAHWYVTPGTALKMHPTFDRMLSRILSADPRAIVVMLRRDFHQTRVVERRMRATFGSAADRLHVLPSLPADRCHALLAVADAVLDTWPLGGMSSGFTAIHAGVPTVTLPTPLPFGRWLASMYETIGVTDLIAADEDDYVRLAVQLAADPRWRQALSGRIKAHNEVFIEDHLAIRELETFLTAAVEAAHGGHPPRPWRDGRFL